jgi:hypothetical protein
MSRAIFKYEIPVDDQWHDVPTPLPAKIVHVACIGGFGTVNVWAEVTPDGTETATRKMRVFGTGFDIPEGAVYVGTAPAGPFVWHVYAEATK